MGPGPTVSPCTQRATCQHAPRYHGAAVAGLASRRGVGHRHLGHAGVPSQGIGVYIAMLDDQVGPAALESRRCVLTQIVERDGRYAWATTSGFHGCEISTSNGLGHMNTCRTVVIQLLKSVRPAITAESVPDGKQRRVSQQPTECHFTK